MKRSMKRVYGVGGALASVGNAILYDGDFIGMPTSSKTAAKFAMPELGFDYRLV